MVLFKAGAHQGERKQRLATQGAAGAATADAVSKTEKLALLQRPWADNAAPRALAHADGMALLVVDADRHRAHSNAHLKLAHVDLATYERLATRGGLLSRPGGDFVLRARADDSVREGEIWLSEAQRLSLRVCENEAYEWRPFDASAAGVPRLAELSLEAQLVEPPAAGAPPLHIDSEWLGRRLAKRLFGVPVSDNELFIVEPTDGEGDGGGASAPRLVVRVTALVPEAADDVDESAVQTSAMLHCWRGLVGTLTTVRLTPSTSFKGSAASAAVSAGLVLENVPPPRSTARRGLVQVETEDGEVFPVSRELLRPCIALTHAVRSADDEPTARVSVGCLAFDRALLWLEASAKGAADGFAIEASVLDEMGDAAEALGCRALADCVSRRRGDFISRIQLHRWADVVAHNDRGGCWIAMSGMVFDLEAWLPEHPGGSTIIPAQALNRDSTVFFELYHASRESFGYLRSFYIGEVLPEDRRLIPNDDEVASADFMAQLESFCSPWRLDAEAAAEAALKSHLGGQRKG